MSDSSQRTLALIAHDNKKTDLVQWIQKHLATFKRFNLVATGTTGTWIERETGLSVTKVQSGPWGGDIQIGALVAANKISGLIFLWDPLSPHSHDVDVKALLRVAVLHDVPLACNLATAEYVIFGLSGQQ